MPLNHFQTLTESETNDNIEFAIVGYARFHNVCVVHVGGGTSFLMLIVVSFFF